MAAVVDVLVAEQLSEMAGLWLLIAAGIVYSKGRLGEDSRRFPKACIYGT
jgi:hypothetical protein